LRGRSLSFKLFPLSFREFLKFKGFEAEEPFIEDERGLITGYLEEYLSFGGFPEIVDYDVHLKLRTLREYLDMVVYSLVERYGIERISVMKALLRLAVKNFSRRVSIKKLYNSLSSGTTLSKNTVYEYFSYLEDVGFVIPVRKFSFSERESMRSIAKLYLVDNGFPTIYGVKDSGYRMENVVAIELLRRKHYFNPLLEVCYWQDRGQREVDFVLKEGFEGELLPAHAGSFLLQRPTRSLHTQSAGLGETVSADHVWKPGYGGPGLHRCNIGSSQPRPPALSALQTL